MDGTTPRPSVIEPFLCSRLEDRGIGAVIFDWDDTILDSYPLHCRVTWKTVERMNALRATQMEASENGEPNATEPYIAHYQPNAIALRNRHEYPNLAEYYPHHLPLAKTMLHTVYAEEKLTCHPLAGALDTLRMLKANGIPFAIASNSDEDIVQQQFRKVFGDEFPDAAVVGRGGERNHPKKPDPAMIHDALERLGHPEVKGKPVYFVGDTHHTDVMAATRAGLSPILFGHWEKEQRLESANIHHLPTYGQIDDYYERLLPHAVGYVESHAQLQAFLESKLAQERPSPAVRSA